MAEAVGDGGPAEAPQARVLVLEAFHGGSHKRLIDCVVAWCGGAAHVDVFTLPAKKWHWRLRTAALHFAEAVPRVHAYTALFTSSTLNLAELCGLRPDLAALHKVLYMHENQLTYPVREEKTRDYQQAWAQFVSCKVADVVLWNSEYNHTSFTARLTPFLNSGHMPKTDALRGHAAAIAAKSSVAFFPLALPTHACLPARIPPADGDERPLHIVWAHRWEHDKAPEVWFDVLARLCDAGLRFVVHVMGERTSDVPAVFASTRAALGSERVGTWGYVESHTEYMRVLATSDVAVSTARHEFFGVGVAEAVWCGCVPLLPNALVYPELYPKEHLYGTPNQLFKRLRHMCRHPSTVRAMDRAPLHACVARFAAAQLRPTFLSALQLGGEGGTGEGGDTCEHTAKRARTTSPKN